MSDEWLRRWNRRYAEAAYAYGEQPNEYLRAQMEPLTPGKMLFAAEGEGRNAVYAARLGWEVHAFDISEEGQKKALQLSEKQGVTIDYRVGNLPDLGYQANQFDALALIYAHFPPGIRSAYHRLLDQYVRPGGMVLFEAFGKKHLPYRIENPQVGGPAASEFLFSEADIKTDFPNYEIQELAEQVVELAEGSYHNGIGSVVRFIGRKKPA